MNFFHYIDNAEIEERAYAYLLSLCDNAEMLYACNRDELDGLEITAVGTKCEGLISAITGVRRGESSWENLSYEEYLELAKPVFSEYLYEKLAKAGSYKGLKPDGFPQTFEESLKYKGAANFCETELVREINRQLDMLKTVFYIEEGLDDWHIDGEKERTPTIIINREKE